MDGGTVGAHPVVDHDVEEGDVDESENPLDVHQPVEEGAGGEEVEHVQHDEEFECEDECNDYCLDDDIHPIILVESDEVEVLDVCVMNGVQSKLATSL